jgi:hypothetical protein
MAQLNYQPAEILDFTKGMTDNYVNGPITGAEILTNFFTLKNRSIRSRPGTLVDSEVDPQIPGGNQRVQTLISYNEGDKLFAHSSKKLFHRNPINYSSLLGPAGGDPFSLADANTYLANTEWNRHLVITSDCYNKPVKVYRDNSGTFQLRTAGLPKLASEPVITPVAGAGAFIYGFCYIYEYKIDDQTFIDYGPMTFVNILNSASPDVSAVNITAIPALANGSGDNYDVTEIRIGIYRTISGGVSSALFALDEIPNGDPDYVDNTSDDDLQLNPTAYTAGGVPNNDPPPLAKFCHSINGFTYYAHYKEGSEIFPTRIRQSQALDPDSVPVGFLDELEDEITGLSSVNEIPIVGCKKHIYRIDSAFDILGRGGMVHKRIADTEGCISHESFVQAEESLFWFGNDGICYSDGNKVYTVTNHLKKRYARFVATLMGKNRKIKGAYDESAQRIHWTISTVNKATGQEECDAIWCLDLQWGINPEMCCYLWTGGEAFFPTSVVYHNKVLYRGDRAGYVLFFDEDIATDPKIIAGEAVATWYQETIIWTWRSCASNFGTSFVRKMANKILISAKNETNVSIGIRAINDDGRVTRELNPIRWRKNFTWGDEDFVWGDPDFVWYYGGTIEVDRRFPAKGLRFNYIQIEITNSFSNILNSDVQGNCIVSGALNTATLVDTVNGDWPSQSVDYFLYLEHDNYQRAYKIISRTDDTIVVQDVNNTLMDGEWKWQIKGYRKNEILNLVGVSISWAALTRSHDTGNAGDLGGLKNDV